MLLPFLVPCTPHFTPTTTRMGCLGRASFDGSEGGGNTNSPIPLMLPPSALSHPRLTTPIGGYIEIHLWLSNETVRFSDSAKLLGVWGETPNFSLTPCLTLNPYRNSSTLYTGLCPNPKSCGFLHHMEPKAVKNQSQV